MCRMALTFLLSPIHVHACVHVREYEMDECADMLDMQGKNLFITREIGRIVLRSFF